MFLIVTLKLWILIYINNCNIMHSKQKHHINYVNLRS